MRFIVCSCAMQGGQTNCLVVKHLVKAYKVKVPELWLDYYEGARAQQCILTVCGG